MPEPFKLIFSLALIQHMAAQLKAHCVNFDDKKFTSIASHDLAALELKARSQQITAALQATLPNSLIESEKIIINTLANIDLDSDEILLKQDPHQTIQTAGIEGWQIMPLADYIGIQALNNIKDSIAEPDTIISIAMNLFKATTQRFSAEFGIRFMLNEYPKQSLKILATWLQHPSAHVRRLISEGTRPRLPWGMQLTPFIQDPHQVIELLEALKDDSQEYVRRSVANNLNDIAKDHPELVNQIVKRWLIGADKNRLRLIKHACRTLIKQGNPTTLALLGYHKPTQLNVSLTLSTKRVVLGGSIELLLTIQSSNDTPQALLVDYVVHHQKANGNTSGKTFKWKLTNSKANGQFTIKKKHAIKPVTTRVYYPGEHQVDIMINGEKMASTAFELVMP